jgi:hypothetical protein
MPQKYLKILNRKCLKNISEIFFVLGLLTKTSLSKYGLGSSDFGILQYFK